MKKIIRRIVLFFACLVFPSIALAGLDIGDILNIVGKIYGVNLDVKNINATQLSRLDVILKALTGTHRYGSLYYDAHQYDWGAGANHWQDVLTLHQNDTNSGPLAAMAHSLQQEYPISPLHSANKMEEQYYRLQAQTTLAARSASQLAFEQLSQEEAVIQALHRAIDKTVDSKSAADLNNRLISEQNSLSAQHAKLLAILVQQMAVAAQEKSNRATEDAEFFDYR